MKRVARFLRWLLSFRYKVDIQGMELLDKGKTFLLMPSHVALVDPIIMYAFLTEKVKVYPLATRLFYDKPLLKPFFKFL